MDKEAVKVLREGVSLLPKGDQGFAASLLMQLDTKGDLSEKQWTWIVKLAHSVETAGVPDFTKEVVNVGEFGALIGLFEKARKYLKYPKIMLKLESGEPLQLGLAGSSSKAPGTISISDGGPFGNSKWYGRVTKDGEWEPAKVTDDLKNDLTSVLTKLALAPAATAAEYGKMTGHCCFCMGHLSDERSTKVGYGKVCAQRWGLPWGKHDNASFH